MNYLKAFYHISKRASCEIDLQLLRHLLNDWKSSLEAMRINRKHCLFIICTTRKRFETNMVRFTLQYIRLRVIISCLTSLSSPLLLRTTPLVGQVRIGSVNRLQISSEKLSKSFEWSVTYCDAKPEINFVKEFISKTKPVSILAA